MADSMVARTTLAPPPGHHLIHLEVPADFQRSTHLGPDCGCVLSLSPEANLLLTSLPSLLAQLSLPSGKQQAAGSGQCL